MTDTIVKEDEFESRQTVGMLNMLTEEEAFINEMEDRWHQNQRILSKKQSEFDKVAINILSHFKVPCFKTWEELGHSPYQGITPRTERDINVICRAMGLFAKKDNKGIRISADTFYLQNKQLYIKFTGRTLGSK